MKRIHNIKSFAKRWKECLLDTKTIQKSVENWKRNVKICATKTRNKKKIR